MKNERRGIAVLGLNGSGKSTLAHALARELGLFEIDAEDYYFPEQRESRRAALEGRPDPSPSETLPYSDPRTKEETEAAILRDAEEHPDFILSGVTARWDRKLLSRIGLVLLLRAPAAERVRRVEQRELLRYGDRVLPGGDLYEQQKEFRRTIAERQESDPEESAAAVGCPVIGLDAAAPREEVLRRGREAVSAMLRTREMQRNESLYDNRRNDMPKEVILLKLGEVALKGLNRRAFEDVLLKNIRRRLKSAGEFTVTSLQSTVYVEPKNEEADMDLAEERCRKIFGIVGVARAGAAEKDLEKICQQAAEYLEEELEEASAFKVECKRSDKRFPYKSPEISAEVGAFLLERYPHLRVDVHHPDVTVRVEVRESCAYVHTDPKPGAGGIPVGTGGKAAVLISGGLDSPVAAWQMAKRGVELTAVHFASPPYTSELAHEKVVRLLRKVSEYSGRIKMVTVNFTRLQEAIRDHCQEDLGTVILRRFMLRAAELIAREEGCSALITGESLGQVASQTIQAIACTDAVASMPVFRPLIGSDKAEIVKLAYQIDTYDISIEPYEDCCTIFTPRHPRTRPILHFVEEAEKAIDGRALLEDALSHVETLHIVPYGSPVPGEREEQE